MVLFLFYIVILLYLWYYLPLEGIGLLLYHVVLYSCNSVILYMSTFWFVHISNNLLQEILIYPSH